MPSSGNSFLIALIDRQIKLSSFIAITGVTPIDFRKNATETEFLGSILDFILSKDMYTLEFCASHDYEQQSISIARQFLPGSHLPNWT